MRRLGGKLIDEFRSGQVIHDGILYLMFRREVGGVIPLYFGKAEIYGKGDANLSANVSDLATGHGKFGRWGYNYRPVKKVERHSSSLTIWFRVSC